MRTSRRASAPPATPAPEPPRQRARRKKKTPGPLAPAGAGAKVERIKCKDGRTLIRDPESHRIIGWER